MKRPLPSSIVALVLLGAAASSHAQFGDLLNRVVPGLGQATAPAGTDPSKAGGNAATTASKSAAMVDGASDVSPNKGIKVDLPPDRQCNRPQERFNIAEKLVEYGGTEATLRLERLIKSDYKYSDLTPKDKQMLQYVAKTTIWVPVEIESALGTAYNAVSSNTGDPLTEVEEMRLKDVQTRLDLL